MKSVIYSITLAIGALCLTVSSSPIRKSSVNVDSDDNNRIVKLKQTGYLHGSGIFIYLICIWSTY